jgi:hypothetical protein
MFYAVVVPDQALVLDWVFADGPPQNAVVYDNNHMQDFHAIVPMATPDAQYWVEEKQLIYEKLQEGRRLREEAIRAKVCPCLCSLPSCSIYWEKLKFHNEKK